LLLENQSTSDCPLYRAESSLYLLVKKPCWLSHFQSWGNFLNKEIHYHCKQTHCHLINSILAPYKQPSLDLISIEYITSIRFLLNDCDFKRTSSIDLSNNVKLCSG
jgi:hypothetical protein